MDYRTAVLTLAAALVAAEASTLWMAWRRGHLDRTLAIQLLPLNVLAALLLLSLLAGIRDT